MALQSSRSLAFLVGALGTLGVAQGCVDDGVSMHVICSIQPEVDENGCTWSPDGELCVAVGTLNVRTAVSYTMSLRVESGLKPRARDVPPAGEPNGVQLISARVELRTTSGARLGGFSTVVQGTVVALPNPYDAVASGYLPPNGVNATTIVVIPGEYIATLKASGLSQIVAAIKLKGETNGTLDVESSDYLWPIRLVATSPVMSENECTSPADTDVCSSLIGQDAFAYICTE